MIKCVIYDLDDTLYDFKVVNEPAFAKMCEEAERRFGISAEKFGEVFASAYRGIGDRMPEEILELEPAGVDVAPVHSRTLRINYTLEKLGLPLFPHVLDLYDIYWDYILEHMQKEPYIEEVMQELKRRGIRIGIGTNMTAHIQYHKVNGLGLGPYIDFMMTSDESIFDKPDERFFQMVVHKAGCAPEECLFVGDNYLYEYVGATKSGLNGLWYNRLEKPWNRVNEDLKQEAIRKNVMITDHRQVLEYLEGQNGTDQI